MNHPAVRPDQRRLRIAICSVGSELLLGDLVDGNAAWLGRRLTAEGARVVSTAGAPDDVGRIAATLRWLAADADVVLVGGGLGPTPDDVSREAIAEVAGVALERSAELAEQLRARFADRSRQMPASNLRQAEVPVGADVLPAQGSAPGLWLDARDHDIGAVLVAVPGVPWEQRAMVDGDVVHRLRTLGLALRPTVTRTLRVVGMAEAEIGERVEQVLGPIVGDDADWSVLASAGQVRIRVSAVGDDHATADARAGVLLAPVREAFGAAVAGEGETTLAATVLDALAERGERVAVAESATAGLVTAALGDVPGASRALAGGVVTYATATKHELLGVEAGVLDRHPAVSAPVTAAMAQRVRALVGVEWGLAVTGVAGPDPQDGVAVGTIHWCVHGPRGATAGTRTYPGDRASIRERLVTAVLDELRRALEAG